MRGWSCPLTKEKGTIRRILAHYTTYFIKGRGSQDVQEGGRFCGDLSESPVIKKQRLPGWDQVKLRVRLSQKILMIVDMVQFENLGTENIKGEIKASKPP